MTNQSAMAMFIALWNEIFFFSLEQTKKKRSVIEIPTRHHEQLTFNDEFPEFNFIMLKLLI